MIMKSSLIRFSVLALMLISVVYGDKDCKYDKGRWLDCDPETGMQRKILRLKGHYRSPMPECMEEKQITRPCKKQCKYVKGQWSDCQNGMKQRIDKLRSDNTGTTLSTHCKQERIVNKSCKKQCNYLKSDWSKCENGYKNKTLTLIKSNQTPNDNNENNECESIKTISKPCHNEQLRMMSNDHNHEHSKRKKNARKNN